VHEYVHTYVHIDTHRQTDATHIVPCPPCDQKSCCMQVHAHTHVRAELTQMHTAVMEHTHTHTCTHTHTRAHTHIIWTSLRAWLDGGQGTWESGQSFPQGSLSTSHATRFAVSWPMVWSILRMVVYFLASSRHPNSFARYRFVTAFRLSFFVLVMGQVSR